MTWLEEFLIKRQANASNVFLMETNDPKRIEQFINFVVTHEALSKFNIIMYNINDGELMTWQEGWQPIELDITTDVLTQLREMLRNGKTLVIIKHIVLEQHAKALENWLIARSHDPLMYRHKSTVVVFTVSLELFDRNVRRLCVDIDVPLPDENERKKIIDVVAKELSKITSMEINYDGELINAAAGLNLHEIETVLLESFTKHREFRPSAFSEYKVNLLRQYGIEYVEPKRGFESVGGYEYLKRLVRRKIIEVIKNPDRARYYGLEMPRGILMFGPPGTGKTWFAKAMAKEVGLPFIKIDPSTFLRGIVGETEARIKEVIRIIETLAPAIVFIDEIDQIGMARDRVMSTDSGVTRRMTNMLLEWLGDEKRKSIIVGATNFIGDLDSAFIRAGRFDVIVPVLYPDLQARHEILRVHTRGIRCVPLAPDVDLAKIAEATQYWTGAELQRLVLAAAEEAFIEHAKHVEYKHFMRASKTINININKRKETLRRYLRDIERLEALVDKTLLKSIIETIEANESGARYNLEW